MTYKTRQTLTKTAREYRRRNSGMILLLVIAILVLLAIMGSVYVLMAGADRQSTNASNGNADLAMAQTSVLNIVRGQIGTQLTEGNGYYLNGTSLSKPYARTWDMPEIGNIASAAPTNPTPFYEDSTGTYRSEPWLVSLPVWLSDSYLPPNTDLLWTGVNSSAMQSSNAAVEVGNYPAQTQTVPNISGAETTPPAGFTPDVAFPVNYPIFSMLSPFLYDPSTGLNDIGISYQSANGTAVLSTGTNGTVYAPNASVVFPAWSNYSGTNRQGVDDSCWNLLPYSSPNGTRYRFAVRIMDENSMLNVNVGQAAVNPVNFGGQYFNGYGLSYEYDPALQYFTTNLTDATVAQMNVMGLARSYNGAVPNYSLPSAWQYALWTRNLGGSYSTEMSLFGVSSNLANQAFQGSIPATGIYSGTAAPFADSRLGFTLPNTFGYNPFPPPAGSYPNGGQPWKMFFTASSEDRPLRTEIDAVTPPFGLVPTATYSVNGVNWQEWPASPGKIFANAPADSPALIQASANTTATGADVPGGVALTAAQIAQAMGETGFTPTQALSFAANYMTYRMGVAPGGTNGPSFIDSTGPCVRGYNGTNGDFSGIGTFAAPANQLVAGVAAQPFIVQAAVYVQVAKTVTYSNYAVVLYNPFGVSLDLSNWQLNIYDGATYTGTVTLTKVIVPAEDFAVIEQSAGSFATANPTYTYQEAGLTFNQTGAKQYVVLTRPSMQRGGGKTPAQMPVDEFEIDPLMTGTPGTFPDGTGTYTLQRNCVPHLATTSAEDWYCDNAGQSISPVTWTTLGITTGTTNAPAFGIPLYDRFADPGDCPGYYGSPGYVTTGVTPATGSPFLNIADFDNCPFLANIATAGKTVYFPLNMLSSQVQFLGKNVNEPNPNLQYEASARFDFYDNPSTGVTPPDPEALALLDYISFDSVYSDGSVNDGPNPRSKLTVPGRININTASMPVLEAMIGSVDFNAAGLDSPSALATYINQFRLRQGAFSAVPGLGFHSKAELTFALATGALSGVVPSSINARDNATGFAELYNMATVRSDSFICYTYIQALRLNEEYLQNGGAYNVTDWYNASQGIALGNEGSIGTTDSTQNASGNAIYPEFILEGQKRFVALINRTNATINGAGAGSTNVPDPQVVAVQGMTQ